MESRYLVTVRLPSGQTVNVIIAAPIFSVAKEMAEAMYGQGSVMCVSRHS